MKPFILAILSMVFVAPIEALFCVYIITSAPLIKGEFAFIMGVADALWLSRSVPEQLKP